MTGSASYSGAGFTEQRGSLRSQDVAEKLRQEVLSGLHPAGTRLRQVEIATRLGVSTTPVREAFRTLAEEGLVVHDSHRGVIVFEPSPREVREIYEIRRELESLATRLASPRVAEVHLDEMDAAIARMRDSDDPHEREQLNRLLHSSIYVLADRPRLNAIIDRLCDTASVYLRLLAHSAPSPSHRNDADDEHQRIVDALRRRDADAAAAEVRLHLSHSERSIEWALSAPPGREKRR